jgi:nucleotide-binding universal stress UspA family protein
VIAKILAGIDGSVRAHAVLAAAVEMAERFGSDLYLLRAVTIPPEYPAAGAGTAADPLPAHLVKTALSELTRLASQASCLNARLAPPLVRIGESWRVVLDVSDELDVDLIVVGSHGYGGLDRILGTTAGRVANLATRSVLVVHERDRALPSATSLPYR